MTRPDRKPSTRWRLALLIFLATCLNYYDRQLIGLLKPVMGKDLGWSETDFSRIVTAFTASYAIGLLLAGRLLDRIGTKWGYLLAVLVWTIASMGHALAATVGGFILARILLGLGEAGNFPAGMKAIAEWFPVGERGKATGLFNSGTSVGVVVVLLTAPIVMSYFGWHGVFVFTGILGVLWMMAWLSFHNRLKKNLHPEATDNTVLSQVEDIASGKPSAGDRDGWGGLLRRRETWAYVCGKLFIDPVFWFFLFWLPSYFSSTFRIDLSRPSPELMVIYASTTFGSIFGGYLSSWLITRGWTPLKSRKSVLLAFAFLELCILATRYADNAWTAVAIISLAVAVHQAWATNIFTLATDLFPKHQVSSVVGIGGMAGSLGGIAFPLLVGWILETHQAVGNLTGGYNLIFTICSLTYLFAWLMIHLLTRKA